MATAKPIKQTRSAKQLARSQRIASKQRFLRARKAEAKYARQLRTVARQVGNIVKQFAPKGIVVNSAQLNNVLHKYADLVKLWAPAAAESMLTEVAQRDAAAWTQLSREIGQELRKEIMRAPTGKLMRKLLDEQVVLITSLPIQAASRVHELTIRALSDSTRASEVAQEILKTGQVTESRANLIARTEVARTASLLTEARATHVESPGYFWRTAGDSDVRPEHRILSGKFIRWDEPPVAGSNGERAHAGQIYNCRCYPEVVLPEPEDI